MLLSLSIALLVTLPISVYAGSDTGIKFGHTYKFENGYISNGAWARTYFSGSGAPKEVALSYTYKNLSTMTVSTIHGSNASSTGDAYTVVQVPSGITQQAISGYSSHRIIISTPPIENTNLPL
jgi:hypothetical protein